MVIQRMDKFLKKKKINYNLQGNIEPHEVILDKFARKHEEELGIRERRFEVPLMRKSLFSYLFVFVIVISLLFLRTAYIQLTEGKELLKEAESNKYIFHKIQAERGAIYDKNLNQLVFNIPIFRLVYDKRVGSENNKALMEVSQILKIDFSEFKKNIETEDSDLVIIEPNLDHLSLIILETKLENLPGFTIERFLVRDYPNGETSAHVMGYMGKISKDELAADSDFYSILDYVGRDGLERSYESVLRKNPGKVRIEKDVLGKIISSEIIELPESGNNLVLWLDSELQTKAKEILERHLKDIGSKSAVLIAMDPNTGGILSLVSMPSFDNNAFSKGDTQALSEILESKDQPLFNRVISGIGYPTGSTIKPLVASAALELGTVSLKKSINCTGLIELEHEYDPDITYEYHDWRIHGWTDIRKAIAESCNIYFYALGGGYKEFGIDGLGPKNIIKYLKIFGWGDKTNIDLPAEGQGILPVIDNNWRLGNTYHLSIGQGAFSVTPIQVTRAYSAIANGGKLLEPKLAYQITDEKNNVIKEIESKIINQQIIDPENLKVVKEGMRRAVTGYNAPNASAVLLSNLPVSAAAKTGTAETNREGFYHNWINVFAPYENPEIVMTIMVQDIEGVRAVASPIAYEILNWYFTRNNL
jgi:penicillin-binding protein 2